MSIETEFESTITNVKNAYQGLDNLGTTIPQNKTIENIKNCLDEIYNKFPKTDYAEGSNITLSNTLKGKLDFEDGIVGIGDTQQTQYEGYNLCEAKMPTTTASQGIKFTNNGDGTYTVSGTNSSENSVTFRINQSTQIGGDNLQNYEDGTYTLDLGIADANIGISLMKNVSWTTYLGTGYGTRLVSRAITNATNTFIYVAVKANASFSTPVIIKPMFVKGSYTESTIPSFEPYVGGTASPNPSYPQDIEVVRGKNLLPLNEADFTTTFYGQNVEIKDEVIKISGSATQFYSISIGKNGLVTPSDTSRITFKVNSGIYKFTQFASGTSYSGINVRLKDEDTNTMYTTGSTITLTETHTFSINIFVEDTDSKNAEIKIQLEKGSQATSYLPYNTLEVVERGKNAFAFETNSTKTWYGLDITMNNSSVTINGTSTNTSSVYAYGFNLKPLKLIGTYKLSGYTRNDSYLQLYWKDKNGNIKYKEMKNNPTITFDEGDYLFQLFIFASSGTIMTFNNETFNLQLEEGSTATTYEPYQTPQTYQLSLGEYEFAKIGNYVDTIEYDVDEDKVYKNEVINKYQFTGNELFGKSSSTNLNGYIFNFSSVTTNILVPANNGTKANILSNAFITKAVDTIIGEATYGIGIRSDRGLYIGAPLGSFENVSALQTYLANNITFMYYTLTTPVKKEITGTLADQIKALYYSQSFTGTTIIKINGQLPLIIKVRGLKGE